MFPRTGESVCGKVGRCVCMCVFVHSVYIYIARILMVGIVLISNQEIGEYSKVF